MNQGKIKLCIFSIISLIIFFERSNAMHETNFGMGFSESVFHFISKWVPTPKPHITLVLPTKGSVKLNNVLKLTSKLVELKAYFRVDANITKYNNHKPTPNELFWFPFEAECCAFHCHFLHPLNSYAPLRNKFLVFIGNRRNVDRHFQSCTIQFDSNIVVYYQLNNTNFRSELRFEEIYKIEENQRRLSSNLLGRFLDETKQMDTSGLQNHIWQRRRNLEGTRFTAITEKEEPYITKTIQSTALAENNVVSTKGYYSDIMNYLMLTLNFTVDPVFPKKRRNWTYLIETVGKGECDIGLTVFSFTRSRSDIVDFSYGINAFWFDLFYVKQSKPFQLDVYFRPFHADAWYSIFLYLIILLVGLVATALMPERRTECATINEIFSILSKAMNFVLRSVIGKRMSSEPKCLSTRLAFVSALLCGFFIITLYRAILVAFVAISNESPPVKDLNEIAQSKYNLAVMKDSTMDEIFLKASDKTEEAKLRNGKKILRYSIELSHFIDKMVQGKGNASDTILFHHNMSPRFSDHYPCKLTNIKGYHQNNKQTMGMVFKKNWQFTGFFNYQLLIMKEIGMLDRLFEPYLKSTQKSCANQQTIRTSINIPLPVGMDTAVSLYILILLGFVFSIISLMIELGYKKNYTN